MAVPPQLVSFSILVNEMNSYETARGPIFLILEKNLSCGANNDLQEHLAPEFLQFHNPVEYDT
jgi:hypothetical protein